MRNMSADPTMNRLATVGATVALALGGNAVTTAHAIDNNVAPVAPDAALTAQECAAEAITVPVMNIGYNGKSLKNYKVTVQSLTVNETGVTEVAPLSSECEPLIGRKIEVQQSIETEKPNVYKVNSAKQVLSEKEITAYNKGEVAGAVFATRSAYKCVKGKGVRQTRATVTMSAINKADGASMAAKTYTVTTPSRINGKPNGC